MSDDNHSTISGGSTRSTSDKKIECPCCKNELSLKHMFNHIRVKHEGYFQKMTTAQWLNEAASGKPLRIFWEVMNDFDESEITTIYGCLSTNKTFQREDKAIAHFKKNSKDLTEHNKQVKKMMKTRVATLKLQAEMDKKALLKNKKLWPEQQEFITARDKNDPELIVQWSKYIDNLLSACARLCDDTKGGISNTIDKKYPGMKEYTVSDLHALYQTTKNAWTTVAPRTTRFIRDVRNDIDTIFILKYAGCFDASYASFCCENGSLNKGDSKFADFF